MEVPHKIWLQLVQWFQRRYLHTHTERERERERKRERERETSETLYPLPAYKHTLTMEPSALNKTVHVFLHTRTQQLRVFPDEKKKKKKKWGGGGSLKAKHYIVVVGGVAFFFFFSFFPDMMNKQNIGSREKLSPCKYTVLYPGKIRLCLPAILAGN